VPLCTPRSSFSPCRADRGCTSRSCFSACRGGRGCTPRSSFSASREGRACTPRRSVSACRADRRCTPRSRFSPSREGRGCTPHSCISVCRRGRGCSPHSCVSLSREGFSPITHVLLPRHRSLRATGFEERSRCFCERFRFRSIPEKMVPITSRSISNLRLVGTSWHPRHRRARDGLLRGRGFGAWAFGVRRGSRVGSSGRGL